MTAPTTSTELLALPLENDRRAWLKLDAMAAIIAHFAPDYDTTVRASRTFGYQSARFPDGFGGVTFEPAGTIVCTDDAVSFIQWDSANGVTLDSALTVGRYAIAEVTCAGGVITRINDLRDLGIHTVPSLSLDDLLDVEIYDPVDDDALRYDATLGLWVNRPMGAAGSLEVEDEGATEVSPASILDFRGSGVTVTDQGSGRARVTIPGGVSIVDPPSLTVVTQFLRQGTIQGSSNPQVADFGTLASAGSAGNSAPGSGSYQDGLFRPTRTHAASANVSYGWRSLVRFWRGANAGEGGFVFNQAFSFNTVQSGHRLFVGLYGVAGGDPTISGDPSSRLNIVGYGMDAGDSTIQLMHNDGAGSATKIDTTLALAAGVVYVTLLSCAGGGADIVAQLFTRDSAGLTSVHGPVTISTELPVNTTFLAPIHMANSGAETTQGIICFHEWGALT